jgi:hypothetical protein
MSKVSTNNCGLRYAIESTIGALPGSPIWRVLEPNTIGAYGATITTVARRPISPTRGRRKGTVVDLNSSVEFEADFTMDAFSDFAEGLVFAEFANKEFDLKASTGTVPPPATTNAYTIDAASALLAGKMQWVTASYGTLLFAKGYAIAANNGLKVLTADVASTDTSIAVAGQGVVAETPPTNASLQVAGVRILDDEDLTLTVTGSTATLVSAGAITNWATLGLRAGQFIHIGSSTTVGAVQNALGAGGTAVFGYARITSISGATLNLDKLDVNLSSSAGAATFSQDIMFGRFLRNVPVSADADDNRYLQRSFQFEASYPNLGGAGVPEYEYAIGNLADTLAFNLPLTEKATMGFGFIGTNSDDITASRKTGASTAILPLRTTALNTSSDIASITSDVVSLASEVCFKGLTVTINNSVSPEKCLGHLGASDMNVGLFEVTIEGQMLFTNKAIVNAIKNNTTVTFTCIVKNDDGAVAVDMPELTLGGGGREFPVDESVLVNITGDSFTSSLYGYDLGISMFPSVPTAR